MNFPIPLIVLIIILGLAGIGLYCLLITRNLIKVVIALQIDHQRCCDRIYAGSTPDSDRITWVRHLALTIIVADTIVAVVGLALAVQIRLRTGSLDIKDHFQFEEVTRDCYFNIIDHWFTLDWCIAGLVDWR